MSALLTAPLTKRATVATRRAALPALRRLRPERHSDADPYRVLWIETTRIAHLQDPWEGPLRLPWLTGPGSPHRASLRRRWHAGAVLDGDWDRAVTPLEEYHLMRVLRARYLDGADWEDVPYVRKALHKVRAGERAWGGRCRTEQDVHARCRYLDDLHARLRDGGYDPARAASGPAFTHFLVNIGRDGRVIRNNDGKHRIVLSHLLGIEHLQARVLLRHAGWQRIRDRVRAGDRHLAARFADHPDLADLLGNAPPSPR